MLIYLQDRSKLYLLLLDALSPIYRRYQEYLFDLADLYAR
jgi:hypothetical protein